MLRCRARQLALDGKFVKEVMGGGASVVNAETGPAKTR